jgi:NADP-dependent 3-hydroxy acid dehydrogenase YdfG
MTGIEGRVVAITGATAGIGEAAARRLAAQGARVMIGARRAERLEALAADIVRAGGEVRWRRVDVTDRYATQAFVSAAHAWRGRLDVLVNAAGARAGVNAAGARVGAPLGAPDIDAWDRAIDVNLRGVLHAIAAVLPLMQAQRHGHVVCLAGAAERVGGAGGGPVPAAADAAVRAICDGLRAEAGAELRVTLVPTNVPALAEAFAHPALRRALRCRAGAAPAADAIAADAIAAAIVQAIAQPPRADADLDHAIA